MKKVNRFCHSFQNVKPIYYKDSLHIVKYFKPLFHEIDDYAYGIVYWQNLVSQRIRILYKINKKGYFKQKCQASNKYVHFYATQYLVGSPFAWITASMWQWHGDISLCHCSGVMEAQVALIAAFRSFALLGLVSLIFLLTIAHRFSMGFRSGWVCWPIKHSNTMVIEPAFGTFGSVGRWQVLL